MAKGVTLELTDYSGKVGRCEKNHVVKILSNEYGFCEECANEIQGYSTLYVVPKGYEMPGGPQPVELEE